MSIYEKKANQISQLTIKEKKGHWNWRRLLQKLKTDVKRVGNACWTIVKFLANVFKGAILFAALGYFIPELRQQLPSFYFIVDMAVNVFENFCSVIIQILK